MYATDQLREDHESILAVLAVLEHLASRLEAGLGASGEDLAAIVDYLRTFADRAHHGKEEDLLFPALAAAGIPREGGPIGVMLAEHTEGRGYIRAMAEALGDLGNDAGAAETFARNALSYVGLLRSHIAKENQVLFFIAEQHLSEAEHVRLAEAFCAVEQERLGPDARTKYERLTGRLAATYLK